MKGRVGVVVWAEPGCEAGRCEIIVVGAEEGVHRLELLMRDFAAIAAGATNEVVSWFAGRGDAAVAAARAGWSSPKAERTSVDPRRPSARARVRAGADAACRPKVSHRDGMPEPLSIVRGRRWLNGESQTGRQIARTFPSADTRPARLRSVVMARGRMAGGESRRRGPGSGPV